MPKLQGSRIPPRLYSQQARFCLIDRSNQPRRAIYGTRVFGDVSCIRVICNCLAGIRGCARIHGNFGGAAGNEFHRRALWPIHANLAPRSALHHARRRFRRREDEHDGNRDGRSDPGGHRVGPKLSGPVMQHARMKTFRRH